ncbi:MAG: TolC family protein [Candidatus Firestonebacteria bacterium]|nr:TolC family protein [Candidatus Firestonebacteria bacterium]
MKNKIARIVLLLFLSTSIFLAEAPLSFENCVKETIKNNTDLKSARENIFQAEQNLLSVQSGGVPQISAGVSQDNSYSTLNGQYNASSGYRLSGSYTLYDGNKYTFDAAAAKEKVQLAKFAYDSVSASIRTSLRTAFLELFKTQELVKITEDIRKRRKDNYNMIKLSYEAGQEHRGAVLLAEANLAQAEYEAEAAKRNVEIATVKLARQLGRKNEGGFVIKGEFAAVKSKQERPDFKKMSANNSSYKQKLAQKNIAENQLKSSQTASMPEVSLSAGAARSVSDFAWTGPNLSAGIDITLSIFDGGRRSAAVNNAASSVLQAEYELIAGTFDLELALYSSWINLINANAQVGVRTKFLEATKERASISEVQYTNGIINFDNWIIIEDDLVNSKKTLLDAQVNALSAENAWLNAAGKTLE